MEYRVIALDQRIADQVRTTLKSPQYGHPAHVEVAKGTGPCRLCLRPFRTHEEERVLFTHNPFPVTADLPSPGPIFIHKEPCARFEGEGFPPELMAIPLTLEAFDARGVVVGRVKGDEADASARSLLARDGAAYAHVRHAEAGCFIARVEPLSAAGNQSFERPHLK
jgi:hypothetical protein